MEDEDFISVADVEAGWWQFAEGWDHGYCHAINQSRSDTRRFLAEESEAVNRMVCAALDIVGADYLYEEGRSLTPDGMLSDGEEAWADWRKKHPRVPGSPKWERPK